VKNYAEGFIHPQMKQKYHKLVKKMQLLKERERENPVPTECPGREQEIQADQVQKRTKVQLAQGRSKRNLHPQDLSQE
jgi:hypothetical protein